MAIAPPQLVAPATKPHGHQICRGLLSDAAVILPVGDIEAAATA